MTDDLKRTPLAEEHLKCNARMVDFGGWYMPVQYTGLVEEHETVRTKVGLFDVSHMGEIRVKGKDAERFLDYLTVNQVGGLVDEQIHYTALTYPEGTIVDDLLIYRVSGDEFLLVVNAGNQPKDLAWIQDHMAGFEVSVIDESADTGQIAIQGPLAEHVLQRLTNIDLSRIKYYWFKQGDIKGIPALVSRTGYTGEDGFECYVSAGDTARLWRLLLEEGKPEGILPAGLGARDTLRLEARMALYGNDIDNTTTVLEAGLGWILKLKKKCDFIGKEALKAQKEAGLKRKLVGFTLNDRGIARHGYPVVSGDQEVGMVTSGSHSPTLKQSIGMAYVPVDMAEPGTEIQIKVRNKTLGATVIKGPFYKKAQ